MSFHIEYAAKNKADALFYVRDERHYLPDEVRAIISTAIAGLGYDNGPIMVKASGHLPSGQLYDNYANMTLEIRALMFVDAAPEPADTVNAEQMAADDPAYVEPKTLQEAFGDRPVGVQAGYAVGVIGQPPVIAEAVELANLAPVADDAVLDLFF